MAQRPIFIAEVDGPDLVRVQQVEFQWFAGMSMQRRQLSMRSLHEATQALYPEAKILEASRMSDTSLGTRLSAFNLPARHPKLDGQVPLECVFQACKVFENGGPFLDLLSRSPTEAKRDSRLSESGRLTGFSYGDETWPTVPLTSFYDWIYLQALQTAPDLAEAVKEFGIFTDIAFNPAKSINCQAASIALFVSLSKRGILGEVLSSKDRFLSALEHENARQNEKWTQGSLFD